MGCRHFIMVWDTKTREVVLAETTLGWSEWIGMVLHLCKTIYKLGYQDRFEVIHVGTERQSKTFTKNDIKIIGRGLAEEGIDDEGVVAMKLGNNWLPMVGGDMDRMNSLKPIATEMANQTGKKITLTKFSIRTDMEVIKVEE